MAHWQFPDHDFNLEDKTGTYMHCRIVSEDEETVVVDYTANTTGRRMRLQLLKDDIKTISWPAPTTPETLLREAQL